MKWHPVKGYEKYLEIAETGQVKSLDRIVHRPSSRDYLVKGKIRKQSLVGEKGQQYFSITLTIDKIRYNLKIHRILAETFIPNPNNLPCVNHKDGNKLNNSLNNLEWCTHSENTRHAVAIGLWNSARGENNGLSKMVDEDVFLIRELRHKGLSSREIAKQLPHVTRRSIQNVYQGKTWTHI